MPNKAIILREYGGAENLKFEDIPDPKLHPDHVVLRHTAIGVSYVDSYYRSGLMKVKSLPMIPGHSGVGIVEQAGANVKLKVGTRAAYCFASSGAYSQRRLIAPEKLFPVPQDISDDIAAASLYNGMIAHMAIYRVFNVKKRDTILVQNATDGAGHLITQWAKLKGAKVIGTVPSEDKIDIAKRLGCDAVSCYKTQDTVKLVRDVTEGAGAQVVYDSVGKETFPISFKCASSMGLIVCYDQSCGAAPALNIMNLASKSLYITKPNVFYYKHHVIEAALTANELYTNIRKGKINVSIGATYKLSEAAKAHTDMINQSSYGAIILKP